jgi:hypothetical protein
MQSARIKACSQKLYELRLAEDKVGKAIRALPTLKDEPSHV